MEKAAKVFMCFAIGIAALYWAFAPRWHGVPVLDRLVLVVNQRSGEARVLLPEGDTYKDINLLWYPVHSASDPPPDLNEGSLFNDVLK